MDLGKRFAKLTCSILAAVLILAISGGTGSRARAGSTEGTRLIGLFMTTRDLSPYVGEDGVLWASIHPGTDPSETEYRFEGIDGLRFICYTDRDKNGEPAIISNIDEGISRADLELEDESSVQMSGTILFVPGPDETCFFYNPVLKAQDGSVFAVPGDPMAVDASMSLPDAAVGQTLRDERKHTEHGAEVTDVTNVSMEIGIRREPLRITLLQFSDAHALLKAEEYAPGTVPEEIVLPEGTEYLLVETRERTADGALFDRREVIGREDDGLYTLSCREDGICIQHYHEIVWAKG